MFSCFFSWFELSNSETKFVNHIVFCECTNTWLSSNFQSNSKTPGEVSLKYTVFFSFPPKFSRCLSVCLMGSVFHWGMNFVCSESKMVDKHQSYWKKTWTIPDFCSFCENLLNFCCSFQPRNLIHLFLFVLFEMDNLEQLIGAWGLGIWTVMFGGLLCM